MRQPPARSPRATVTFTGRIMMLGSPGPPPGPHLRLAPGPRAPSESESAGIPRTEGGTLRLGDAPHFCRIMMRLHGAAASHGVSREMNIIIGTCSLAHSVCIDSEAGPPCP